MLRFLFHNYLPEENKGLTVCASTLKAVYDAMDGGTRKGVFNQNVTFESFQEENLNKTSIEEILERVQKSARGKKLLDKDMFF